MPPRPTNDDPSRDVPACGLVAEHHRRAAPAGIVAPAVGHRFGGPPLPTPTGRAFTSSVTAVAVGSVIWRTTWRSCLQRTLPPEARPATLAFFSGTGKLGICLGIVGAGILGATIGTQATVAASVAPAIAAVIMAVRLRGGLGTAASGAGGLSGR